MYYMLIDVFNKYILIVPHCVSYIFSPLSQQSSCLSRNRFDHPNKADDRGPEPHGSTQNDLHLLPTRQDSNPDTVDGQKEAGK